MKRILIFLLLSISSFVGFSQKNNFEIGLGGYKFYNVNVYNNQLYTMFNLKYSRSINEKFKLFISYNTAPNYFLTGNPFLTTRVDYENKKMESKKHYVFIDLGITYRFLSYRKHALTLDLSPSYAIGENEYTTFGEYGLQNMKVTHGQKGYFGLKYGIKYDYSIFKKRMNLGAHFAGRNYVNNFPFQINYGLHIGYNF